jgi:hypothetical protein
MIQCNRLIEIANRTVDEVQTITQAAGPEDTAAHLKVAEVVDQAAGDLQSIELSDEQLQSYKQQFISMYTSTSKATRQLVNVVDGSPEVPVIEQAQAAEQAYQELRSATSQEGPLVDNVNTYCSTATQ